MLSIRSSAECLHYFVWTPNCIFSSFLWIDNGAALILYLLFEVHGSHQIQWICIQLHRHRLPIDSFPRNPWCSDRVWGRIVSEGKKHINNLVLVIFKNMWEKPGKREERKLSCYLALLTRLQGLAPTFSTPERAVRFVSRGCFYVKPSGGTGSTCMVNVQSGTLPNWSENRT